VTNLPSGTVTFLFTDIEGSTKLAQNHPDKWEILRERHHAILQSAMDAHYSGLGAFIEKDLANGRVVIAT